jgi:hypothetical protein
MTNDALLQEEREERRQKEAERKRAWALAMKVHSKLNMHSPYTHHTPCTHHALLKANSSSFRFSDFQLELEAELLGNGA